ncbi:hypothetical protein HW452_16565 [Halomonas aquamarina]|uniref:Uncharacterized protein n=1 Tax=Vreelandella aquamarina TaxID=77097 RepID=A0ACC5VZ20_9GAMM|nr:hypothetical protein [Halomonas aquamarina]MBZ5489134.1 hypothetical protein [Halomonas aquamarina]
MQIDENYSNLCLRSYERFQINGSGQYVTIQRTFTTTSGVVAFSEGDVFVGSVTRNGDRTTYNLTAKPGTWVRAYIFDTSEYGERYYNDAIGMRIRNPNTGRVVFDSRNKYLRLVDFIQGDGTSGHNQNKQYAGKNLAAIQGSAFATWFVAGSGEFGPFFSVNVWASMRASGDRFVTSQEQTQINAPPPVGRRSATQPNWNYLLIDTSNF